MRVTEISLFDVDKETGEVTPRSTVQKYQGSPLGEGYFVFYKKAIEGLLKDDGLTFSALKLYLKLASMQTFGDKVVVANSYLRKELGMCKEAYYGALNWLIAHNFVKKTEEMGNQAFLLNPKHTACGTDSLKKRSALWSLSAKDVAD